MKNPYESIMDIKQRRLAFLNDIASFYNSKNRGVTFKYDCCYGPTGTSPGCAIGRWFNRDTDFDKIEGMAIEDLFRRGVLPIWMSDLGWRFLYACQHLHDTSHAWDENGLTKRGKMIYRQIKSGYIDQDET